jgi:hypothetical protein
MNIPLNNGKAWEQVVRSMDDAAVHGGAPKADFETLRRTVTYNNLGLSQGLDTFTGKWRSASPRMKSAVFGPSETKAIDSLLREYGAVTQQFKQATSWADTRARVRGRALQEVEENMAASRGDSIARAKTARDSTAARAKDSETALAMKAQDLDARVGQVQVDKVVPTPQFRVLEEVWNQYSPTRNLTDSPFLPHTLPGFARLLAAHVATKSARTLRTALYQATKLGRPAMLYNLVARQTRIERKHPEEFQSFDQFVSKEDQQ